MSDLEKYLHEMIADDVLKIIISHPHRKSEEYKKIVVEKKNNCYQIAKYTEKQVFHENIKTEQVAKRCSELIADRFKQINGLSVKKEHILLVSKKGICNYKVKNNASELAKKEVASDGHNRKKNYILQEGTSIAPLIDMGIFTKDGKVVSSMYDKYKQINRFIEILDDEISKQKLTHINVIDFGCGKSYLTFIVYYYLTEVINISVDMVGLDLKADVIKKCNDAAKKYGYEHLKFEVGDINGYQTPFAVDMVMTLHACDTATDFALYNAVKWDAKMIFSVPCCQHELNGQMKPENLGILSRYGIIKERFSALATDAIRGNLLEYCGYKTQLLEFVDLDHTPKNILIRAIKKPMVSKGARDKYLSEIQAAKSEFGFDPTLYQLLLNDGMIKE